MSKLHKYLESHLNFDDGAKDIEKFADALCCFELDSLILLW